MSLLFDLTGTEAYRSGSQKARVMTERWVLGNQYCPACGCSPLTSFVNNSPVADFMCGNCGEQFELKSKRGAIGRKIADGAYRTMIERITSDTNPNFLFLSYSKTPLAVANIELVPKHFLLPQIIEQRRALASSARRAGWVGCNILMDNIPLSGRIFLVRNGRLVPRADVMQAWKKTIFLRKSDLASKSWLLSVMACLENMKQSVISLQDVYTCESELSARFPGNNNVRAKIRQQLQVLRDQGYLEFVGHGVYRLCNQPS
jgi:type II restriction enzyme